MRARMPMPQRRNGNFSPSVFHGSSNGAPTANGPSSRRVSIPRRDEDSPSDASMAGVSTRSLASLQPPYPTENGRQYHSLEPSAYFMPNDEEERTRLFVLNDLHRSLLLTSRPASVPESPISHLTLAPILSNPTKILDLGCGTGEWAIEMGEHLPDTEVIGIDLSAMWPGSVPGKVFFEIDDLEAEDWTFEENAIDLVHSRDLAGAFADWSKIFSRAFHTLKPGGYLEIAELGDIERPRPAGTPCPSWDELAVYYVQALTNPGTHTHPRTRGHITAPYTALRDAGFTTIREYELPIPLGDWPTNADQHRIGKLWLVVVLEGIEAAVLRPLTRDAAVSEQDARRVIEGTKRELRDWTKPGAMSTVTYVLAQKPLE